MPRRPDNEPDVFPRGYEYGTGTREGWYGHPSQDYRFDRGGTGRYREQDRYFDRMERGDYPWSGDYPPRGRNEMAGRSTPWEDYSAERHGPRGRPLRPGYMPTEGYGYGYGRAAMEDRGFMDRAADEVSSWFGDEEAQSRREQDYRGTGPRNYRRTDSRIEEDVNDHLTDDRVVDASDVTVKVEEGEVTLDGYVHSRQAKRRAEDCADRVSGVKHVQNNLRVRRPGEGDADVTQGVH